MTRPMPPRLLLAGRCSGPSRGARVQLAAVLVTTAAALAAPPAAAAQALPPELQRLLLRDLSVPRIQAYQEALVEAIPEAEGGAPLAVGEALTPLCRLAQARVEASGEARRELRAALIVVTAHALGRSLAPVLGRRSREPRRRPLTLWGRDDLAKHFLASALATLWRDRAFADALGLSKELDDADGGSGFSFADLAADRAGVALAEHAAPGDAHARRVIARLAEGPPGDADLMPDPARYPEGLSKEAFEARWGSTESPAFRAAVRRIDRAIGRTPLQRSLRGH